MTPTPPGGTGRRVLPRQPLFLARESFRRRRVMDAARLLPLLGVFLLLLPMAWGLAGTTGTATAHEAIYVFVVWLALILAAFLLARRLRRDVDGPEDGDDGGGAP
jgi:membrane protein implicated in regulation of membrane protease activity